MIEASIVKKLGEFRLAAELRDEGFICLSGRNGSGKSSFLKALAGFLEVDEGYIRVDGADVSRLPVEKRGMVLVTPSSSLPHLDVDSHLRWGARLNKVKLDGGYVAKVKELLGISFRGPARDLSLGMRERVALATAFLSSPDVILVDEAFANLDNKDEFIRSYRKLAEDRSIDVVFASQTAPGADQAGHLYSVEKGVLTRLF